MACGSDCGCRDCATAASPPGLAAGAAQAAAATTKGTPREAVLPYGTAESVGSSRAASLAARAPGGAGRPAAGRASCECVCAPAPTTLSDWATKPSHEQGPAVTTPPDPAAPPPKAPADTRVRTRTEAAVSPRVTTPSQ